MSKTDESVKVVVRIRPMSSEELRNGNQVLVDLKFICPFHSII